MKNLTDLFKDSSFAHSKVGEGQDFPQLKELYEGLMGKFSDTRRQQFLTGRLCAHKAMNDFSQPISMNDDRSPCWPTGVVGSISHSDDYYIAASSRRLRAVGVDVERIGRMNGKLATKVLTEEEILKRRLWQEKEGPFDTYTLIFSAKESLFKVINPIIKKFFGFQEAKFTSLDFERKEFVIELIDSELIEGFDLPMSYEGRFEIDGEFIITAIELSN